MVHSQASFRTNRFQLSTQISMGTHVQSARDTLVPCSIMLNRIRIAGRIITQSPIYQILAYVYPQTYNLRDKL